MAKAKGLSAVVYLPSYFGAYGCVTSTKNMSPVISRPADSLGIESLHDYFLRFVQYIKLCVLAQSVGLINMISKTASVLEYFSDYTLFIDEKRVKILFSYCVLSLK